MPHKDMIDLPLADLCLKTIVGNFPIYSLAFTTSKNEIIKRMLEFLQRKYSYNLLKRLEKGKLELPEEYLDLLINKHLNILKSTWLVRYSWQKITFKMAEIGCNIEEINLEEIDLFSCTYEEKKPWQDIICYFPNLKVITLGRLEYTESYNLILQSVIRFCPNIEEIDCYPFYSVVFETPESLPKNENGKTLCTKLKKLCLSTPYGNFSALEYFIKNFKTLEIIENIDVPFVLYELHKNDLSSLDKVKPYSIRKLNFTKYAWSFPSMALPSLANIVKVCLSVCPHLKSIIYSFVDELDLFPCPANLEELKMINVGSSEINVNRLFKASLENLLSLKIAKCALSVSLLAESCPRIKELILDCVNLLFDDDSKPVFNLSACIFENINVIMNVKAISLLLSSSSKLEFLAFRRCDTISSEVETLILKCCESYSVKKLSFYCSEIRNEFLKDLLLNCTTLKYLNICRCFDSDSDTEDELLKLAEILPNKPEISMLDDDYTEHDEVYDLFKDYDDTHDDF